MTVLESTLFYIGCTSLYVTLPYSSVVLLDST